MAHLKRSHHSEGLSKGVIELIRKSWQTSSESAYSSPWHQWDSWCMRQGVDHLSVRLNDILEILLTQFQAGKQYCTINTLESAISMRHMKVEYQSASIPPPPVSRLLKGVFKSKPSPPRYFSTWDATGVLTHFKNPQRTTNSPFKLLPTRLQCLWR